MIFSKNTRPLEDKYYTTSDLALGAALIYAGYKIENIERPRHEQRCYFYFKNDLRLKSVVDSFLNDEMMVNAKRYFNDIRELKKRINNNFF